MTITAIPATKQPRDGRRAIVRGHHKEVTGSLTITHPSKCEVEATLVAQIGNQGSSEWFVEFDDLPGVKFSRQLVRFVDPACCMVKELEFKS